MEDSISTLSKTLGKFCNHVESSSSALKQSLDRRPIRLSSASSTFLNYVNRQVSAVSGDINLLESMASGTVSFEELLGHCNEVYKKNESDIASIEDQLKCFGYVSENEDEEVEMSASSSPFTSNLKMSDDVPSPRGEKLAKSFDFRILEDDPLLEESPSLKNLGFSDASLASLASKGKSEEKFNSVTKPAIVISKQDYECVSSSIRSLASWEDLLVAVEKINPCLTKKEKTRGSYYFYRDDVSSFDLGPKATCYLLLLLRMDKLVVENIDGKISYRVL